MYNTDEIVRALREMLPPQVDYAELVCAESWAHGQHYVWEDPEPYIISEAADLIESLLADAASYQQVQSVLQREGFADIETMINKYKKVMSDANEISIEQDEMFELLQVDLAQVTQTRDDYATAARAIALCLSEFCDKSLPYDQMIADAARKAADALARVTETLEEALQDMKTINAPCNICDFVDMLGCVHKNHCTESNQYFQWRGLNKS